MTPPAPDSLGSLQPLLSGALAYTLAMRVGELLLSRRNAARVLARGGRRIHPDGMPAIAAVHAGWLIAMPLEALFLTPLHLSTGAQLALLGVYALAELARFACIAVLGDRWNVSVLIEPGRPPVRRGLYRLLPHPNYAAVVVGLVALPLAFGLWRTAALVLPLKLLALRRRIRIEAAALRTLQA